MTDLHLLPLLPLLPAVSATVEDVRTEALLPCSDHSSSELLRFHGSAVQSAHGSSVHVQQNVFRYPTVLSALRIFPVLRQVLPAVSAVFPCSVGHPLSSKQLLQSPAA